MDFNNGKVRVLMLKGEKGDRGADGTTVTYLLSKSGNDVTISECINYISSLTGATVAAVEGWREIGETYGYDSEEFAEACNWNDDPVYQAAIMNLLKVFAGAFESVLVSDVITYTANFNGVYIRYIEFARKIGESLGYDSEEFQDACDFDGDEIYYFPTMNLLKLIAGKNKVTLTGSDGTTTSFVDDNLGYDYASETKAGVMSTLDKKRLNSIYSNYVGYSAQQKTTSERLTALGNAGLHVGRIPPDNVTTDLVPVGELYLYLGQ